MVTTPMNGKMMLIGATTMMNKEKILKDWLFSGWKIIALEGPDGVGKTFQANKLKSYFDGIGAETMYDRLPNHFRETMFSDKVTEIEKIALSLMDYDIVVQNWEMSNSDLLILDRVAHFSIEVYNIPNVPPEWRTLIHNIVESRLYSSITPNIIFNLNRPSFRPPDDSYFEKRHDRDELTRLYDNISFVKDGYLRHNTDVPVIMVYGDNGLSLDATPDEVTNFITDSVADWAEWKSYSNIA